MTSPARPAPSAPDRPRCAHRIQSRRSRSWLWCLGAIHLFACQKSGAPPAHPPAAADAAPATQPTVSVPPPSPFTAEGEEALSQLDAEFLRQQIATISADATAGRAPATAGDAATRQYLIDELQRLGFSPGNDGQWEQPFELVGLTTTAPQRWQFKRGKAQKTLKHWDQYIASSGLQAKQGEVKDAELVFVGYGIEAPEYDWNDFKGQDLKGKILVMLNNDPDWDPALFAGETRLYYGRWNYKYESAARQGAAGAIIIHTTPSAGYPFSVVQTSWGGEQFELPTEGEPRIALESWVTESAARELATLAGKDFDALVASAKRRDFMPVPLGITTSLSFKTKLRRVRTANVVGTLAGTDPQLGSEYVVYTAHHDHLGVGKADGEGDTIYNGALDNAAGCAQVLAIAKAYAALPAAPKRSLMFLFVGAEEQGLLGSQYYAAHPTVSPGKLAANVNYDGGNIWGRTKDVAFIGKGKSSLDAVVDLAAAHQGRTVKPDQFPDRGHYYRSDQFSFAKIGVPAVYLDTGVEFIDRPAGWGKAQVEAYEANNYHQPSDELEPTWNFEGMLDDVKLGFWAGYLVANGGTMPTWTPGDEFEAARQQALAQQEP